MKYKVEYKNSKATYTADKLENVAHEYGIYELENDNDYMQAAVMYFCATHFMYGNAAHLDQYDAESRGDKWQEWKYQPNGNFKGWISASVTD